MKTKLSHVFWIALILFCVMFALSAMLLSKSFIKVTARVGHLIATHLGMFTNSGKVSFTPDASNPNILHPRGGGVFTAANGDKLNFVIVSGALDLTTGIGTGEFAFTGGTGRFANATGRTSGVIQQNVITGAYVLTLVGNIDY